MTAINPTVGRVPRVKVLRSFGEPCPVMYRPGEYFDLDEWWPEGSFACVKAFQALEPAIDAIKQRLDRTSYPACRMTASCSCPLAHSEVVFGLYSAPSSLLRGDRDG